MSNSDLNNHVRSVVNDHVVSIEGTINHGLIGMNAT